MAGLLQFKNRSYVKDVSIFLLVSIFFPLSVLSQNKYEQVYDSEVFIQKGIELHQSGLYTASVKEYDKILRTDPDYLRAQYEKLLSLKALDNQEDAQVLMEQLYNSNRMAEFPELLLLYASHFSDKEEYEQSEKIFKEAEALIPDSSALQYNMAILYVRLADHQKAVDYLKKAITYNPNYASAHYFLGLLAYENGRAVEGSLAMLAYLTNYPTGTFAQEAILKLNSKMGQHFLEKSDVVFSDEGDDFSELDMILRNQLPLNPKYKIKSSIDDVITRQVQAILEYAAIHKIKDGFFEKTYIPFLADIENNKYTEGYTYYILLSFEESLGKKLTSQKKKITDFVDNYLTKDLWQLYATRNIEHYGSNQDVTIYIQDLFPYLMGQNIDGKHQGKFKLVNKQGLKTGDLNYKDNQLDGLQYYYYNTGVKSDEVYFVEGKRNGTFKNFYNNGNLKAEGTYKDDQLEGKYISYYPNGGKFCERILKNGLIEGVSVCYYPNGQIESEYEYQNGKLNGIAVNYNEAGDIISSYKYVDDMLEGEGKAYYDGTKIKTQAQYKKGKITGVYKEFYENGQIRKEVMSENGKITKTIEYHPNGKLSSETFYDNKEEIESYVYYDESGQKYFEERYRNGRIRAGYQYVTEKPEPVEVSVNSKPYQIRNLEGTVITSGEYSKGNMSGEWSYFNNNGSIKIKQNFNNNTIEGLRHDYDQTGNLLGVYNQVTGSVSGLYEGFLHEVPYVKMYFEEGNRNGPYRYFYKNGQVSYEGYLIDNKAYFKQIGYYQDKSLMRESEYIDDYIIKLKNYKKDGSLASEIKYTNQTGKIKFIEAGGLTESTVELVNGVKNGASTAATLTGDLINTSTYINDVLHGKYTYYNPAGNISSEVDYYNGSVNGLYKSYDLNGKLRLTTERIFGKEYGSVIRYYQSGGKLYEYQSLNDKKDGEQVFYNIEGKAVAVIGYDMNIAKYYKVLDKEGNLGEAQKVTQTSDYQITSKYPDGKTAFKLSLKKGLYNDTLEIYSSNGQPNFTSAYNSGLFDGKRVEYYQNGKVYKAENLEFNDFQDIQEYFSEDGKLIISAQYNLDELHGDFKVFKNGNLFKHKIYDSNELVEIKK